MVAIETVFETERHTPVVAKKEVVVVGGGPAGIVAAIAAARHGAATLLIERNGFLGGAGTAGMVAQFFTFFAGEQQAIKGIPQEIVDRLVAANASMGHTPCLLPPSGMPGSRVIFDPELFKCIADTLLLEAGVEMLFHSWVVEALKNGRTCTGVVVENKAGRQAALGAVTIDATGDGDVAARAGAPFEKGEAKDGQLQPMTVMFRMSNVDFERFRRLSREEKKRIVDEGLSRKELFIDSPLTTPLSMYPSGEVVLNMTRIGGVDGASATDLSRAEMEGRRQVLRVAGFLKRRMPGFENAVLSGIAPQIGVRETRRIRGEYILTAEDIVKAREFEDSIARGAFPMDYHDPQGAGMAFQWSESGASHGIPYRCLVPLEVDGLLVAGRCISSTREANAAVRMMATCMATGQAAGTAAALAAKLGVPPRRIDVQALRHALREDGAVL